LQEFSEPGEVTFKGLQSLRTRLDDMIGNYNAPQGGVGKVGLPDLQELRQAVTGDIEGAAIAQGGDLLNAWQRANSYWRDNVRGVVDDPEIRGLAKSTVDTLSGKLTNRNKIATVRKLHEALPPSGQNRLKHFYVDHIMDQATTKKGEFSPATFSTQVDRLGKVLPGAFGGEEMKTLTGFGNLMAHVQRAGEGGNIPSTGERVLDAITTGGGLGALMLGRPEVPAAMVAGAGAVRATANPTVRRILLNFADVKPGSKETGILIDELSAVLSRGAAQQSGGMFDGGF
jgi:hypothetical protein